MYGSYERTHLGVPEFRHDGRGQARPPRSSRCSSRSAARCRTRCSASRSCRRCRDGSGQDRALLRKASQLLQQAGYAIKDGKRVDAKGEPLTFEFLIDEPTFQPHHMPFIKNLGALGIEATLRMVDPVQFRKRVDEFDFDITVQRFGFSTTPGDSLRTYFSSQAAAIKGSHNLAGIADPAVDALIEKIIAAETRADADHRLPRARPRDPRRALLDSALVHGGALDRLLGRVRLPAEEAALCPRRSRDMVVRSATRRRSSNGGADPCSRHP